MNKEYYLSQIYKKDGSIKENHKRVYSLLLDDSGKKESVYHLKRWVKEKGRYKVIDTDHNHLIDFLMAYNIPFTQGNDAKRGGIEGDYISVRFDGRNKFVKELRAERKA